MEPVKLAGDYDSADPQDAELSRRVMEMVAAGDPVLSEGGMVQVAEETVTGRIVGTATAGAPGVWSHAAIEGLPRGSAAPGTGHARGGRR